jgi:hypothetical protein
LYRYCACNETLEFKLRTKIIIEGLQNTQKFRAIINEVMVGDCQVKDLMGSRFPHVAQRAAVWEALMEVARARRVGANQIGFAGVRQGFNVQVDLV